MANSILMRSELARRLEPPACGLNEVVSVLGKTPTGANGVI